MSCRRDRRCGRARPVGVLMSALFAATVGCREEPAPPGGPTTPDERTQFTDPLSYACWPEPGSWPQFQHDPLHTGQSGVDLTSADLREAWRFRPSEHVWSYKEGYSVWSTPVAGTVDGRPLVIAGYYDATVYAVDGRNGERAWEFRPGAPVFATPALGYVEDRPMVFVASRNRSIYGLDASTGDKKWQFETQPWTFTTADCEMSSLTLVDDGGVPTLLAGVWNNDRSASRNIQFGELVVLDAATGKPRWRKKLGSTPVSSPAVARMGERFVVFVAIRHGLVLGLNLADGETLWESSLNEETWSSPGVGLVDARGHLFIGTRLNSVFGLDWRTGGRAWRGDAGYYVDATPAWCVVTGADAGSLTTVFAGTYDQAIRAWRGDSGRRRWATSTGNHAYSSIAVTAVRGRPAVVAMSWDEHVYLLDADDGRVLWESRTGPLIWSHTYLADSLWASPIVAVLAQEPTLLVASFDGLLHAYQPE